MIPPASMPWHHLSHLDSGLGFDPQNIGEHDEIGDLEVTCTLGLLS